MTGQNDMAQDAAQERAGADGAPTPSAETAMDDTQILWKKKKRGGSAHHTHTAPSDAQTEAGADSAGWQQRLEEEQAKAEDYFTRWQRAAADMANMRRRNEVERQEYMRQANAALIEQLLPVLDSFDRALDSVPAELREQSWVDGILRVERQLRAALERAGLSAIEAQGKPFDPNEHEALMQEVSEEPEDTVIGELQRGYKLHDRVLRPAMVKVAKN
jgi:molecular chaperone GrpE